jgi:ribosome-binding protein aMBF1 (putative translation factor)
MRVCQDCYWYRPNENYSDKVRCLFLDRKNWKPIEERNTCDDFVSPEDFKPDPILSMLVEAVNQVICEEREKKVREGEVSGM